MNRLIVALKRIFHKKLYWGLLCVLLILTGIYKLLPAKSQSTQICVAVCLADTSAYTKNFQTELADSASLYQFYYVDDRQDVIEDVQAGKAECGFVVPEGFWNGYIQGTGDPKVSLFKTPASTLSSAISETFFHYIFKVASPQILVDTIGDDSLSKELKNRMQTYMESDSIFRMSSVTKGSYDYRENTYHISLPIYECTCLLVLFCALFGLMMYLQDTERGIYVVLPVKKRAGILCSVIFSSILPVCVTGLFCNLLTYGTDTLVPVMVMSAGAFLFTCILSLLVKKSQTLAKIIPLFLLIAIVFFFLGYIL